MMTCVIGNDGMPLMPTYNIKKVRRMLKSGRAVICGHDPFTIRLTYDVENPGVQPVEIAVDTGYLNVGISVKSENHEYFSREYKLLPDEKKRHQEQKRNRNNRRHRDGYRKPENKRTKKSKHKEKGWIAPSIRHKAEAHIMLVKKLRLRFPLTSATIEMGQFDTHVLEAVSQGLPVPEGIGYQHGPKYGFDTMREAVYQRDKHSCKCCGKSAIKDGATLVLHHIGFKTGDRSNRIGNLLTLCTRCHTPSNHKPGGKLWNLKQRGNSLPQAAFMNSVKWFIYNEIKMAVRNVHITYGAVTKRERLNRNIAKSHANDAYCIGLFHPKHRAQTTYYMKRRRNNRCLEKFYDAKYIDSRDGKKKKASELGCNRTKRSIPRNNPNNFRPMRGKKISSGYRSIRQGRHSLQAGDTVLCEGKKHEIKTVRFRENKKLGKHETVELQGRQGELTLDKIKVLHRIGGWKEVTKEQFYKKKQDTGASA